MNVYPFIEAEKAEQDANITMACALLEVSRSAYYEWSKHVPSARDVSDAELGDKIVDIHTKSRRTYGAPRITTELAESGICVGKSASPVSWCAEGSSGATNAASRGRPSPIRTPPRSLRT